MKSGRPSRTAHLVGFARAVADEGLSAVPGFRDPTARAFLDEMANAMALRTSAIDHAVRRTIANVASQVVILGAGYDGRAWRDDA